MEAGQTVGEKAEILHQRLKLESPIHCQENKDKDIEKGIRGLMQSSGAALVVSASRPPVIGPGASRRI